MLRLREAAGEAARLGARSHALRVPVFHERGAGATLARSLLNVALFVVLSSGAIAVDVWFSRLVRNARLRPDTGVDLVLQATVGVAFLAVLALPPLLVAMEWLARWIPRPRIVVFAAAVGVAAAGIPLYDDLTGWTGARVALPLGVAAVYGALVVLPDGRHEVRTVSVHRGAAAASLAVIAIAMYALGSYREAGIDHPRPFRIDPAEVTAIEIDRVDVGAPGPLFAAAPSGDRPSMPLRRIASLIPDELPAQSFQSTRCAASATVRIEFADGDDVVYGPCRLPRDVELLRQRLTKLWRARFSPDRVRAR